MLNICDGYAAGINYYLDQNPNLKIKEFPIINGRDLIAGFSHRMPLMFGFDGLIKELSKSRLSDTNHLKCLQATYLLLRLAGHPMAIHDYG